MSDGKTFSFSSLEGIRFNLMVSSHERSGTHFLINSLALATPYTNRPVISFDPWTIGNVVNYHNPERVRSFFATLSRNTCNSIVKNHFHADFFFGDDGQSVLGATKVVYIVRDPIETLSSFRRFIRKLKEEGHREGPIAQDLIAFMQAEPAWNMTRYQARQSATVLERWMDHAAGWIAAAEREPNVMAIRFRDLDEQYERSMERLTAFLGLPCPAGLRRPDPKANTVYIPNDETLTPEAKLHLRERARDALPPAARSRLDGLLSYLDSDTV